ncbi:MAG: hypothetical protein M3381_09605 [Actinomycetota bacterium]|nr:hypothetical protein [Actinomycetota bacterium]
MAWVERITGTESLCLVLVLASVAVVAIAVLLVLINLLRQIDRQAARTHTAGKQTAQNTVSPWTLEQTNRDLIAIRDAARAAGRDPRSGGGGSRERCEPPQEGVVRGLTSSSGTSEDGGWS